MKRWIVVSFIGFPLLACVEHPEPTDLGHWTLDIGLADQIPGLEQPAVVLVDSTISVNLLQRSDGEGQYVDLDEDLRSCTFLTPKGVVASDGLDFHVDAAGEGSIQVSAPREACPDYAGPGAEFERDRWSLIAVEPSATIGDWVGATESLAARDGSPGPDEFPADFSTPLGPIQVVEAGDFYVLPVLTQGAAEVRWNRDDVEMSVESTWQPLVPVGETGPDLGLRGRVDAGSSVDAGLQIGDELVALPEVSTVPIDRIASLELVAVYDTDTREGREWGLPLGVVAITRDEQGRRILGAPVEWTLTRGKLAMHHFEDPSLTADTLSVGDVCRARPIDRARRDATIEARVGELVAEVDLDWIALHGDEVDRDNPKCESAGCDCSAGGRPTDSIAALLGLLGLGLLRRRRSPR
ncbi:MYXO-CTERM sorting domain-containing protein [Nannocystaceae bacterium ST9]